MLARYLGSTVSCRREGKEGRTQLDVDRGHGAEERVRHVERVRNLVQVPAAHPRRRRLPIVQQSNLVDPVQIARLSGDVARREVEAVEEVLRLGVVYLLSDDLAVPRFVKLVDHRASELGQLGEDARGDLLRWFSEVRRRRERRERTLVKVSRSVALRSSWST